MIKSDKKISVIIPAYNEERFIEKSLQNYRGQDCPLEIIVVVNNSKDRTRQVAEKYADKVINFPEKIGLSRARNEGAKIAEGKTFIFSDADSWVEKGGVKKIADEFDRNENVAGPLLGKGENANARDKLIFFLKNSVNKFGFYHGGIAGVIVCSKKIFLKTGGFSSEKEPAEQRDFLNKARKCGAKIKPIGNVFAYTSMRRHKQNGYIKTIMFWVSWRAASLFKADEKIKKDYFEIKK